jgi:signal transduction histidine kinase
VTSTAAPTGAKPDWRGEPAIGQTQPKGDLRPRSGPPRTADIDPAHRRAVAQVLADRVQIQQVFLNLILNAVEAMRSLSDGERLIKIRSDLPEASGILVTVEDSGTGIEVEHSEHIFDAFFTTKPNGMGMGLSICQSIIESHDGHLWASPGITCGSIFHLTFPEGAPAAAPRAANSKA